MVFFWWAMVLAMSVYLVAFVINLAIHGPHPRPVPGPGMTVKMVQPAWGLAVVAAGIAMLSIGQLIDHYYPGG